MNRVPIVRRLLCLLLLGTAGAALAAPAARMGSVTNHGGQIAAGSTNVLIAGVPAARVGDFVNCPSQCGPGIPHVGGPIVTGSTTVLINGQSAARIGSLVSESCDVGTVSSGAPTVDIGG